MQDSPPPRDPVVGDVVVCPDEDFRNSMHLPQEAGLIIDLRRDQAKIFFPSIFGESWVQNHQLARIRNLDRAAPVAAWMQRVWYLARTLEAVQIEVERFGAEGNAVRVYHGEVELETVDLIRHELGEELRYYSIGPAGLHKVTSNVAFITTSRADPPMPPSPPKPSTPKNAES